MTTDTISHAHPTTAIDAAILDLQTRVAKLEGATPPVTPPSSVIFDASADGDYGDAPFPINNGSHITFDGVSAQPSGVVRAFPVGGTVAQLQADLADMSIDGIVMAPGSYHVRNCQLNVDRTARPFTVWSPGGFRFQHYLLAEVGLFTLVGGSFITLKGITVRNCAGNKTAANNQSAHVLYVSRGSHDLDFEGFDIANVQPSDEPGGVYGLNGLQIYTGGTGTAVKNVTAKAFRVDGANWATVVRNASSGLVYDGWTVTNSGNSSQAAMDFGTDNTGTVTNSKSSGSKGTPLILGKMTSGGGNGPWA